MMGSFLRARAAFARFGVALMVASGISAGSSGLVPPATPLLSGRWWILLSGYISAQPRPEVGPIWREEVMQREFGGGGATAE
jgi:hypothetical protein